MTQAIIDKALQRVHALTEARARAFLCPDCIDKRCEQGRVCKMFNRMVEAFAWEITAEGAENN